MPVLPQIIIDKKINKSPHVVILGAGASRAAFPKGDRYGVKLPLMDDFISTLGLESLLDSKNIDYKHRNFEEIYDEISVSYKSTKFLETVKEKVYNYFSQMILPYELTLYDKIILCLRKKDIIATFNWDPLLIQAYRRNMNLQLLPRIVFLHGNVGTGVCLQDRAKGYIGDRCEKCGQNLQPTDLLYPIRDKNYRENPFISSEWYELECYLEKAYFLTIFGYSAPKSDINAIEIMKKVWDKNQTKSLAEIKIIDIKSDEELYKSWNEFIVRNHYSTWKKLEDSYLFIHPRRTCEAFAWATLQNDPLRDNPLPDFDTLEELQNWLMPLIKEEIDYKDKNKGFSGLPCDEIRKIAGD